mmetsp:Transcript_76051/g.165977  ORF Transcript_76051/g.165977 Transcript_76051/m.165977 type:complete len:207 (-) Transcript_76051:333-953(-)
MVSQVVLHKCGDEEVAVIIAFTHPQGQGQALLVASLLQSLRAQLVLTFLLLLLAIEVVRCALINQESHGRALVPLDEFDSVVVLPGFFRGPEVERKCLLAPWSLHRVADGGEGRDGLVHSWILQSNRHGAMAAHAVAKDTSLGRIHREHLFHDARELLGDVVVHVVVLLVLIGGGIQVKASSLPKVVLLGLFVWHVLTSRRGVRHH